MSARSVDDARQQNELAGTTKDIGIPEMGGFQREPLVAEDFIERMQKKVELLNLVTTMELPRLEVEVPQFGVPRLSGSVRSEGGSRTSGSGVETGQARFNVTDRQYYILVEPKRDALKNTHYGPDEFGEYIVDQFVERYSNDVGLIGMRAAASQGNLEAYAGAGAAELDTTFTGWIGRAEGDSQSTDSAGDSTRVGLEDTTTAEAGSMPKYDNTDTNGNPQPIDTSVFDQAITRLDSRYRDEDDTVFLASPDTLQEYANTLTEREDALGVAAIMGDSEITPFSYEVVPVNGWPPQYMMFTDPENLCFGLYREMEVDQSQDTDKVHENRLHSRNWLEGQMDFQIAEMQAGTLVTGLKPRTA